MRFSIVMTTYNRPKFLYFALKSLRRQQINNLDHEILVLDDGNDGGISYGITQQEDIKDKLNIRYIHTGCRTYNLWRNMGFAANIGIQQATGEIVVLTNSDIYHLGNTVLPVIQNAKADANALSTLNKVYDDTGMFIDALHQGIQTTKELEETIKRVKASNPLPGVYPANPDMPFFLAVRREHLMKVGGYDEDFIGSASEDCDLLDRLQAIGCRYVYAPPGAEALHLYHGRRNIEQLKADPGFDFNLRLRSERSQVIQRNQGRNWGELIDPTVSQDDAPIHLVLWVTSQCNLSCPLCNQRYAREDYSHYNMSREELNHFVTSCQERNIHFSTIELAGGEPTLWPLFSTALAELKDSGICDRVTFITNGRDAARVAGLANRHGLFYVVSKSQCTEEQEATHKKIGVGLLWNKGKHLVIPTQPLPDSLPSVCSQRQDGHGRVVRQLFYLEGVVWYCCLAYTNSKIIGSDARLSCPFEEDFQSFFSKREPGLPICQICLCNKLVWDQICE